LIDAMDAAASPNARPPTTSWPRFAFTVVAMVAHVALGIALVSLLFPFVRAARHRQVIRWWSGRILRILRVRLQVLRPSPGAQNIALIDDALRVGGRGAMLVMNHVSWLDIFILQSIRTTRFIAKAEIARWPLLGYLVAVTGATFIERGKRHAVREVNHRVATLLTDGELVGMFPEGTTSEGDRLLPFHANLIQPALNAGAPIVVAGVRYRELDGGPTRATLYTGDITILDSLLRLARHGPLVAELHLIGAFEAAGTTRHEIGRAAREMIAATLGFEDESREVSDELSSVLVVGDVSRTSGLAGTSPGTPPDPRDELL
jgi:1-acyl-sn-glycerol-3-phosphate acyltransferase